MVYVYRCPSEGSMAQAWSCLAATGLFWLWPGGVTGPRSCGSEPPMGALQSKMEDGQWQIADLNRSYLCLSGAGYGLTDLLRLGGAPIEDFQLDGAATVVFVDLRREGEVKAGGGLCFRAGAPPDRLMRRSAIGDP